MIFLAAILGAAIIFTSAIEILGERLNLGQGTVGSVLATVGTGGDDRGRPLLRHGRRARASEALGIPAGLIALVLAPLATELPEKFNSLIWLRDNKDTLALGNISGAMVFQSTIPVALGIPLTRWELGFLNTFSAVLALLSGAIFYALLTRYVPIEAKPLMGGGILYVVLFVAAVYVVFFW